MSNHTVTCSHTKEDSIGLYFLIYFECNCDLVSLVTVCLFGQIFIILPLLPNQRFSGTAVLCLSHDIVLCSRYKIRSYIARYPVLGTAQNALHFTACGRPVHSNANSTSLGSIQSRCNYCAKNIRSHSHHPPQPGTHLHRRVNWSNVSERNCPSFETAAREIPTL